MEREKVLAAYDGVITVNGQFVVNGILFDDIDEAVNYKNKLLVESLKT